MRNPFLLLYSSCLKLAVFTPPARHSREGGNPGKSCCSAIFFLGPRLALRALGDDAGGGLFSLIIHGTLIGCFLWIPEKVMQTEPFTIQVQWEKPIEPSPLHPHRAQTEHAKSSSGENSPSQGGEVHHELKSEFRAHRSLDFGSFGAYAQDERVRKKSSSSIRPERRLLSLSKGSKSKDKGKMKVKINSHLSSLGISSPISEKRSKSTPKSPPSNTHVHTQRKSYKPLPSYPWICRKRGQEGRVSLLVQTNQEGRVTKASLHKSSGHSPLDQCALNAVKSWVFCDDPCQKVLSIVFRLRG